MAGGATRLKNTVSQYYTKRGRTFNTITISSPFNPPSTNPPSITFYFYSNAFRNECTWHIVLGSGCLVVKSYPFGSIPNNPFRIHQQRGTS